MNFMRRRRAAVSDDRSSVVQETIASLAKPPGTPAIARTVALAEPDRTMPSESARRAFDAMFEIAYQDARSFYENAQQALKDEPALPANEWKRGINPPKPVSANVKAAAWRCVCEGGEVPTELFAEKGFSRYGREAAGDLDLLHAFRLLRITGGPSLRWDTPFAAMFDKYRETGHPTPLELQAAAEDVGFSRRDILVSLPARTPWSTDDTWPWVAALLPEFVEVIVDGQENRRSRLDKYYNAIGTLPTLPDAMRQLLLEHAVSGQKAHRSLAKSAMAGDKDLVTTVSDLLESRKYEERGEVAYWLADLGADEAAEALQKPRQRRNTTTQRVRS